jgi:molybdate transport system substrate-binding protein
MKKLFCSLLIALLFLGCKEDKKAAAEVAAPSAEPVSLTVFAAASLTEALTEIQALYKTAVPEATITFNFDSSGKLQTQIENGAEVDVFLSAGQAQMNALMEKFIDGATRKDLLLNKVVLIVPGNSTKDISSFEDVMTNKVSLVALGNPSVPVGQYSQEIFEFLKGWEAVSKKASLGTNVKEVLSQVESASVDCGVVYATDAATAKNVKVVASAPAGSHKPVLYPAAVLKDSKNAKAAQSFLGFLSSPQSVAVFEKIGFEVVK